MKLEDPDAFYRELKIMIGQSISHYKIRKSPTGVPQRVDAIFRIPTTLNLPAPALFAEPKGVGMPKKALQ